MEDKRGKMKKRLKTLAYVLLTAIVLSLLGGCGLIESTGLSDEEDELVAEYAAGVIMRYSADKKGGLGDLKPTPEPIPWVDPATVAPAEEPQEEEDDTEEEIPMEEVEERVDDSVQPGTQGYDGNSLAAAIGVSGFDISYQGYETADVYPASTGDDLSFSMQSTPGHKLLVVHLDVMNNDPQEKECDVLSCNVKFRVLINETKRVNEQMTILLNDLKSYNGTVPANSSVDTVLVFEVEDQLAENINNLSLVTVTSSGESTFALK